MMDQYVLLKKLARQCLKKPPVQKNFPKEENKQLAIQIKNWLELYGNNDDSKNQNEIRILRDFLLFHEAASNGAVPVLKNRQETSFYLVIDTNIFFHDEEILNRLNDNDICVLPQIVLDELSNRTKDKNVLGKKSQRILSHIRQFPANRILQTRINRSEVRQLLPRFYNVTNSSNEECDLQILAVTKRLLLEKKPAQLLSNDFELRQKAAGLNIPALSLQEFLSGN
jgi:rRNA-processing protein FCF1